MVAKDEIRQVSTLARKAARAGDWATVASLANRLLRLEKGSAEGNFLAGLAAKARGEPGTAEKRFRRVLQSAGERYDAAVELADLYGRAGRHGEAVSLLDAYAPHLHTSPLYLDMAAAMYARLDLHARAEPLYRRACELQPEIGRFQAGLAACCVYLGKAREAREIYEWLLSRQPDHRQYHYELSRLNRAVDDSHVRQMQALLEDSAEPARNIWLHYAIGKELEDLGRWHEAFEHFARGGEAARSLASYEVEPDLALIEAVIDTCDAAWYAGKRPGVAAGHDRIPVFIAGLPRSGTTLTERILASHSQVQSVGETYFLQLAVRDAGGAGRVTPEVIRAASTVDPARIAAGYLDSVAYKLGNEPWFIEKFTENYLYLGFIAAAFPDARIVLLDRQPMDVCFAMFKQSYFRYAYTLDDVGRYYVAYHALAAHWRGVLGDRLVELRYEDLVRSQESETRRLLDSLGLDFEPACLEFEKNPAPSSTASAVQVREKVHTRSVNHWLRFERELQPLREYLQTQGIDTAPADMS